MANIARWVHRPVAARPEEAEQAGDGAAEEAVCSMLGACPGAAISPTFAGTDKIVMFHVALTRAKDEFCLTSNPTSYTGDIPCRPSRFPGDFPKDMVETRNVGNGWPPDDDPFQMAGSMVA